MNDIKSVDLLSCSGAKEKDDACHEIPERHVGRAEEGLTLAGAEGGSEESYLQVCGHGHLSIYGAWSTLQATFSFCLSIVNNA